MSGLQTIKLLSAATATGAGAAYAIPMGATHFQVRVKVTTSVSLTALTIALEGFVEGSTYAALATHVFDASEVTALGAVFHVTDKLANNIRANITTLTESGTTTVDCWVDCK